jgi:hypothetical protein
VNNKIQGLLPKLVDYYNTTGDTISFNLYQFKDNITYSFVHNLKSYSLAKKDLYKTFLYLIKIQGIDYKKNILAYQVSRRRKFRLFLGGFNLKFKRRFKQIKIKKIQKNALVLKKSVSFKRARKKHSLILNNCKFLHVTSSTHKINKNDIFIL